MTESARILADTTALASRVGAPDEAGAVWRIDEPDRDLDANVIALPPGDGIGSHRGPALDVLIHVIAGSGVIETADGDVALVPGAIVWLPKHSRRAFRAGDEGLRYLTVHRRKTPPPLLGA